VKENYTDIYKLLGRKKNPNVVIIILLTCVPQATSSNSDRGTISLFLPRFIMAYFKRGNNDKMAGYIVINHIS